MSIKQWLRKSVAVAGASAFVLGMAPVALAELDPGLKDYEIASGVSGNLSSIGSDTLANLMTLWAEDFKPTAVPVAIDALAVYVHKDNPIEGMSIAEVDAVFSSTRKCGAAQDIGQWGQLGLGGAWEGRDMQLFGRNSVSGTYGYFKTVGLCKGDFKNSVNEQPGSASVVQSVSTSINGIGYSGIGYRTSSVRTVPISKDEGGAYVEADAENSINGRYPLARFLYVYVNKDPNKPLSPLEREFFKLVFSRQGQDVVLKDGYIPLPAAVVDRYSQQLGL